MALVDILMPQLGTSVVEGTVVEWHAEVGGQVGAEDAVCEISTDKIDSECPAPVAGTLAEIVVPVGETVEVGAVLGRISTDGEPVAPAEATANGAAEAGGSSLAAATEVRSSPVSRRIAAEHGIDLAQVEGSGRGGRVTKKDVLAAVAAAASEPPLHSDSPYRPEPEKSAPPAASEPAAAAPPRVDLTDLGGVAAPLSRMRRRIGEAMRGSQQTTATCHTAVECDMTRVEARRAELGLTALPLVSHAVIETLGEFPDLNATLDDGTITRFERVHLGVAVSLGDEGLIVPVIHDAQNLSPQGLGSRIRDLAKRAREKRLQPDDVQGATFTITSPGAFGALWATPVIDVPQVGILDVEAVVRRPVVITDDLGAESIAIRSMVELILGWDHRAMDGVYAARFLTTLRHRLEAF
ncbi:MAG TPA: dihydrolipoamide acetyltransferase family protein [Solirubrobacterales bacterium]|nr:dihydrolipoamide acetyltransferase family protein [Solirubrobacterales bacterium]